MRAFVWTIFVLAFFTFVVSTIEAARGGNKDGPLTAVLTMLAQGGIALWAAWLLFR